jgi:phosphohistidine phosphatase
MAEMAAKLELAIQQIRHSGKTRAEQTAAIFGEALAPRRGVVAISGINPMDDVQPIASALADEAEPIMLVGHLPFMARLAGLLVNGDPENAPVEFRNSGLLCLEQGDERWEARWHLTPG